MRFYTIKEMKTIINRTEPTIYNYIRKDASFFEEHRIKQNKGGYLYDEIAVERLKSLLCVANGEGKPISSDEGQEIPHITPPVAELEELRGKYEALKKDFERVEAERKQLLEQNGNLLLLLSQEKAEKQALLPAPRRTIGERIRNFFK